MKTLLLSLGLIVSIVVAKAQIPDVIKAVVPDTLRQVSDCVIRIELSNNNKKKFSFPKDYRITRYPGAGDLLLWLERLEKDDKYYLYSCGHQLGGHPIILITPPTKKFKKLSIVDSLDVLDCIERGTYRLQVCFNNRVRGAASDDPIIIEARSKWVEFIVDADRIELDRYVK